MQGSPTKYSLKLKFQRGTMGYEIRELSLASQVSLGNFSSSSSLLISPGLDDRFQLVVLVELTIISRTLPLLTL